MILKKIDLSDAWRQGEGLPFIWMHSLSAVYAGRNIHIEDKLDEIEEVRFFDSRKEIKVVRLDDGLQAWYCEEEPEDHVLRNAYCVRNSKFGGKIYVTWMLGADEDGQTYVSGGRLSGWEEN